MSARLGDGALGRGDRVRRVTDLGEMAARYGTATVERRKKLGRTGLRFWCQIELDTDRPDGTGADEEWIPEHHLVLVRRAGERVIVGGRGSA
ncbi:hypothetical protein [Parafrankia sp. FMc2]|uniref:hypothetical protein n=1 Tax=Parafrankia sp. FMc2 TaxID=3233196 RepID=UPI0034D796E5